MEYHATLHWAYVAIMAISAAILFAMSQNPKGVPGYKYAIHIFVVVWSGLAYSAMAMGQLIIESHGQTVFLGRYIDWVVSTPLLLLSLNLTGKYISEVKGGITATLLGSQAIMILTGLIAELSPNDGTRWFWYLAGCFTLVVVLWVFWGPLYRRANEGDKEIARVYRLSATYLTIQWLLYPLAWAIGSPGVRLLGVEGTTWAFIVLPIISKAGFAFFNLGLLRGLPQHLHNLHDTNGRRADPV